MLLILFLSIFFANTFAQVPVYQAPNFHQLVDFNKSAYAGKWYTISRIPNFIEYNDICSAIALEYNEPLGTYTMILNAVNPSTKLLRNSIAALFPKEHEHSSFTFRYPIKPPVNLGVMTVLATDYKHWGVKAGVINFHKFWLTFAWIDSREPTISPEHYEEACQVLRANNIPVSSMMKVEQSCSNIVNA
ncbi:apolipoprotein D-like [Aphidius gifuensis]|uniref:apolipoprotein D-like n=1 Tax=Aphidius gifuensis TaxID=684658 RepID=UPI001CDBED70|nr:apolipoprotein D-like [Aphidius gifuensis]